MGEDINGLKREGGKEGRNISVHGVCVPIFPPKIMKQTMVKTFKISPGISRRTYTENHVLTIILYSYYMYVCIYIYVVFVSLQL